MAAPTWQQPYTVQLDPETARRLATNGGTILLLDVPEATPVGIDQQVFLTGPNFKGIKMMPPGVHLLSFQARSTRDGALSPPVSTLIMLQPRQVVVRRWQPASEGLVALDEDEEGRYAAGVARFDFDRELAPYDLHSYSQWTSLSCHISNVVLQQLLPPGGEISIMCEAVDPALMNPSSAAEKRLQAQLEEGRSRREAAMQVDPAQEDLQQQQQQQQQERLSEQQLQRSGERRQYSQLPRIAKVPGASAAQLTALNIDKTSLLEQVIARYGPAANSRGAGVQEHQQQHVHGIGVVGEVQFSFIAFVFGQSLEGYMQWKQLLVLLLGCVSGPLESHTELFVAFLTTLTAQMQLGLGVDGLSSNSSTQTHRGAARSGSAALEDTRAEGLGAALLGAGLVEELLPDSFLKQSFRGFFEMLQESAADAPADVLMQARRLESVLAAGLGWDFRMTELLGSDDQSDDEFKPVVVELTEQQLADLGM